MTKCARFVGDVFWREKVAQQDWHGVADAAMDLREREAQMKRVDSGKTGLQNKWEERITR